MMMMMIRQIAPKTDTRGIHVIGKVIYQMQSL